MATMSGLLPDCEIEIAAQPRAQLAAVDRHDRRADRGDRHAGDELDGVFEEGRGWSDEPRAMVDDHRGIAVAERGAGSAELLAPALSSSRRVRRRGSRSISSA